MFRPNDAHYQETLFSTIKDLPDSARKLLDEGWSATFYKSVFKKIDEEKFAPLYSGKYSRPNKPVNELISLQILKEVFDLSDKELRERYFFDLQFNHALGKEDLAQDTLSEKTLNNFRKRLIEYERDTGINLMKVIFEDHRDWLMDEFDIKGSLQRMDSTFIEANIKNFSRFDLIVIVLHNFVRDLDEGELKLLPEEVQKFKEKKKLKMSYDL